MRIYFGIFLIAFATLALEIILSRILSVITWYHLSFFAVSTAMLGMTAGATRVYLQPHLFGENQLSKRLTSYSIGFSLATPVCLFLLCCLPLVLVQEFTSYLIFGLAVLACALPFYFSGIVITLVLTKCSLPVGKLYAFDLVGASLGCLFVLWGLELLDAPSLVILCSSIGVLASLSFATDSSRGFRIFKICLLSLFLVGALINSLSPISIGPLYTKGRATPPGSYLIERWNSFSRVVVYNGTKTSPQLWGASLKVPKAPVTQFYMNIDGEAGTAMRKFQSVDDIEHLRYDVTNIGYFLEREGPACIIGVGGGRDLQSAILFGQTPVTGVELNPIFIDLLEGEFAEFAGLAQRDDVEFV